MAAIARVPAAEAPRNLRLAQVLSVLVMILTAVASVAGAFFPAIYRRFVLAQMIPATQGQDLVTLAVALPIMLVGMLAAGRGSFRGTMAWIGALGYICYTYTGATFGYPLGELFLIYLALFSLSVWSLILTIGSVDIAAVRAQFDAGVPRRSVAAFEIFVAIMLCLLWLSRIIPNLTADPVPLTVDPYKFVFGLDLGMVVPLSVLGAVWLWRRLPWGYLISGIMLIKCITMGLALLAMQVLNLMAGQPLDAPELIGSYCIIAGGGIGLSLWYFRHCR